MSVGAQLVRAALAVQPDKLTGRSRQVLVAMALHALDKPRRNAPAATYYGGHDLLAMTLGHFPSAGRLRTVRRAIQELTDHGLLERIATSGPYRAAAYRLVLPVDNPGENPSTGPPQNGPT